jgi:hypothetical protein
MNGLLAAALMAFWFPSLAEAKSYSSGGGHSYSSSSFHSSSSGGSHSFSSGSHSSSGGSHTFSSGGGSTHSSGYGGGGGSTRSSSSGGSGSKSFNSGGGKSYSSGSSGSDSDRHGYSSAKSYTSGSGKTFSGSSGSTAAVRPVEPTRKVGADLKSSALTFDNAATRARREEASKQDFTRFKESQSPKSSSEPARHASDSYQAKPPPIPGSASSGSYRARTYIPDAYTVSTRRVRVYNVYNSYYSRPWVTYRDPYNSFFWWWLLDRSLDDRAWWAYHHRYDMDPARYEALVENDQQLQARVSQLEAQQAPRDPNYVPTGLDRDLMYSDHYVNQAYGNRPTRAGRAAFWIIGVPAALGACGFFIWLIWFKRWQPST